MKDSLAGLVACALMTCDQFLTARFHTYLDCVRFKSAGAIAKFCNENNNAMFALQVLLVGMLNGIHIRILTPDGDMHTHPHAPGDLCRCAFFALLIQGEHGPEYLPVQEMFQSEWDKQ